MSERFEFEAVVPFVVFSHETVADIFKGIYDMLGLHGAGSLLYSVGQKAGRGYVKEQRKTTHKEKVKLLKKCIEGDKKAKWGHFEYEIDFDTFGGEVRLYDSFLAKSWIENKGKREYSVCAFIAGYISGLIESIFGEKVVVEEKECIATGDDHCVFKVRKGVLGD